MKIYNPKDWLKIIWQPFSKSTLKELNYMMLTIVAYTSIVVFLEIHILKISDNSPIKNLNILNSLLGFAISILLVFRTNTAYDRWWEGRKLWGALVNTSRNLALKIKAIYKVNNKRTKFFEKAIPLYAKVLTMHLNTEKTRLMLDENEHNELNIDNKKHLPNQIALHMMYQIQDMYKNNEITGEELLTLNQELTSFTDVCGACERIKNTPIPFSYSAFIKKIVLIYTITLPFSLVFSLQYYTIPVVAFVFYVLGGLELVAEEIEDPFGTDENDLPMEKISSNIEKHVHEILG